MDHNNIPVIYLFIFRFFGSSLKILTVRNYAEMVKGMLIIVKVSGLFRNQLRTLFFSLCFLS